MAKKKPPVKKKLAAKKRAVRGRSSFRIEGRVKLEAVDTLPSDAAIAAYAFDADGELLGTADVASDGKFGVPLQTRKAVDVELFIGVANDAEGVRKNAAYRRRYSASEWLRREGGSLLRPEVFLPREIWWPFWPRCVCVSGHVYKVRGNCPVPFVKVEIFDVDREWCLWPYVYQLAPKLKNLKVARVESLLAERPEVAERVRLIERPPEDVEPPIGPPAPAESLAVQESALGFELPGERVGINPQPEPPGQFQSREAQELEFSSLGIDNLTLTSFNAPWILFPRCFYSKQLICTTHTDENGYFKCCFKWWPLEYRQGRFRLDWRPDIIVRVTQIIDGVETVIYMDPYSSTRWNVSNAHIDLYLDNPDIECGSGDDQDRPTGTPVFFTRIGNDEVFWIEQSGANTGQYKKPPYSRVAYGHWLRVFGQFGDRLCGLAAPVAGTLPPYYYRLSSRKGGGPFKPFDQELKDTRVHKGTYLSEKYSLGPQPVNGVPGLYQIRNFGSHYWYNPDWIGWWNTHKTETDTGLYQLRLEVFDSNGTLLAWQKVDYRDGTEPPNGVLPPMKDGPNRTDYCELRITLDNKPPVPDMTIAAAINECGVIPWASVPPLNIGVSVVQENGRLRWWRLQYTKGVNPAVHYLDHPPPPSAAVSNAGLLSPVSKTVDATASPKGVNMLAGVTTTCAFALKLASWAHIRNGYGFIYYREQIKAIAVERCPPCPPLTLAGPAATPITLPGPVSDQS